MKKQMTLKSTHGTLITTPYLKNSRDVLLKVHYLLSREQLRFSFHANQRMVERGILYYEVLQALYSGKRDEKRDRFNKEHYSWCYSIEGLTRDGRKLRIGVSFVQGLKKEEKLLVITVIDIGKR